MTISHLGAAQQLDVVSTEINAAYAKLGENPDFKQAIAFLYNGLLDANGNQLTRLDYQMVAKSTITTADLVALLTQQISTTKDQILKLQVQMVGARGNNQKAKLDEMAKKLQDSWSKQEEANRIAKTMEIVKWVVFAVSLIAMICTGVAFPAAIPGLLVGGIFTLMSVIPSDNEGTAITDKWTKAMADSIYKTCIVNPMREALKKADASLDVDAMTDDEVVESVNSRGIAVDGVVAGSLESQKAFTQYLSMALVIAIQLTVTIGVGVTVAVAGDKVNTASTVGSGVGAAATTGAITSTTTAAATAAQTASTAATTAARTASQAALTTAKTVLSKLLDKLYIVAQKAKYGVQVVEAGAKIGSAGGQIDAALAKYNAQQVHADVTTIKAVIAYLQRLIDHDQEVLAELIATMSEPSKQAKELIKREHEMNKGIIRAQLTA